jgi:hypothetical protein
MTQTEYVSDVKRCYQLLLDDKLEISNTIFIDDNMVQVTYEYKNQYVPDTFSTNVILPYSQHLMRDCGCMICWTNLVTLSPTMIQTALFILIIKKML